MPRELRFTYMQLLFLIINTSGFCLTAQVFGLEIILLAIFDEMRSALPEFKADILSDALLADVQNPIIMEWSGQRI